MGESANFDNFKGCEVADLDLDVEFRNAKYMWEEITNMIWKAPNVADIICEQLWVSITFSNTNTCFFLEIMLICFLLHILYWKTKYDFLRFIYNWIASQSCISQSYGKFGAQE